MPSTSRVIHHLMALMLALTVFGSRRAAVFAISPRAPGDPVDTTHLSTGQVNSHLFGNAPNVGTGTAIGPHLILTAAHVLNRDPDDSIIFQHRFPGFHLNGTTYRGLSIEHPSYTPGGLADLGLILTETPILEAPASLVTSVPPFGATVGIVGYGGPGPTQRRQGTARVGSFDAGRVNLLPDPHFTEPGDSGGPAYFNNSVFAIHSQTFTQSGNTMREMRIDPGVPVHREFVDGNKINHYQSTSQEEFWDNLSNWSKSAPPLPSDIANLNVPNLDKTIRVRQGVAEGLLNNEKLVLRDEGVLGIGMTGTYNGTGGEIQIGPTGSFGTSKLENRGEIFVDTEAHLLATGPTLNIGLISIRNGGVVPSDFTAEDNIWNLGEIKGDSLIRLVGGAQVITMGSGTTTTFPSVNQASASGGVLTGTLTVNGDASFLNGGVAAPGDNVGAMTIVGIAEFGPGARFAFDITDAAGASGAALGWDRLDVQSLTISATASNPVMIDLATLDNLGEVPGLTENFDSAQTYSWTFISSAMDITGFSSELFEVDSSGFLNEVNGGTFSIQRVDNDLNIQFTPVPEPSSLFLLAIVAVSLLAKRCRRRKRV